MTEYKVWAFAAVRRPICPCWKTSWLRSCVRPTAEGTLLSTQAWSKKRGDEFWRPGLFAMLAAVQQGRVNVVMVEALIGLATI